MPKSGQKFINAVGREVVAHGGATPKASRIAMPKKTRSERTGEIAQDVFGREYDIVVPAFLTTGTRFVIDRLAFTSASRSGSPFGMIVDIDSLNEYADSKGYVFPDYEIGMPPLWWQDSNLIPLPLQPGFSGIQIVGLTDNPTYGPTAQIGVELSYELETPAASQEWKINGVVVGTGLTYTPVSGDDLGRLSLEVVSDNGDVMSSAVYTVRYAPPVAGTPISAQAMERNTFNRVPVSIVGFAIGDGDLTYGVQQRSGISISGSDVIHNTWDSSLTDGPVTIYAENSGGRFSDTYDLTITPTTDLNLELFGVAGNYGHMITPDANTGLQPMTSFDVTLDVAIPSIAAPDTPRAIFGYTKNFEGAGDSHVFQIRNHRDQRIRCSFRGSDGTLTHLNTLSPDPTPSGVYTIRFLHTGSRAEFYLNGVLQDTSTDPLFPTVDTDDITALAILGDGPLTGGGPVTAEYPGAYVRNIKPTINGVYWGLVKPAVYDVTDEVFYVNGLIEDAGVSDQSMFVDWPTLPTVVTPPVISGTVAPGFVLTIEEQAVWGGEVQSSSSMWTVNGIDTGVVGDTYTIPAGVTNNEVFAVREMARNAAGEASVLSNSLTMIPPQLEVPQEILAEGNVVLDLADYSDGYIVSYDAVGVGVESIVGSVVTITDSAGLYPITFSATNPAGTSEAVSSVRVIPENIYFNPQLAGGSASGPVDGDNPPTGHGPIGFNSLNSAPVDNGDGTFNWHINPEGDTGRSYLLYSLSTNHPTLQVGDVIALSWKVENHIGTRTPVLTATAGTLNNVDVRLNNNFVSPNQRVTVQCTCEILAVPFEAQLRVGVGPTTDRAEILTISDPIGYLVVEPSPPISDMWTLERA